MAMESEETEGRGVELVSAEVHGKWTSGSSAISRIVPELLVTNVGS
jgi:hypothetical protein